MARTFAGTGLLLVLLSGSPASAIDNPLNGIQLANFNPLDRGPLADFLNLFREQAIRAGSCFGTAVTHRERL